MNRALWMAQGILAAVFAFADASKLIIPPELRVMMSPFAVTFVQFIGVCGVLGTLGMSLPLALKTRTEQTTLVALALTVILGWRNAQHARHAVHEILRVRHAVSLLLTQRIMSYIAGETSQEF